METNKIKTAIAVIVSLVIIIAAFFIELPESQPTEVNQTNGGEI